MKTAEFNYWLLLSFANWAPVTSGVIVPENGL